jgi:hypothetical protein
VHVRKGGAEVLGARGATREASKEGEGWEEDDEDMEPFMVRTNPCVSDMVQNEHPQVRGRVRACL